MKSQTGIMQSIRIPPTRYRKLRTWTHGKMPAELQGQDTNGKEISLLDLASNDYLGLSKHPDLIEAARLVMLRDGVGAAASRLVTGSRPIHKELEEELALWLGKEKVLLFPSGFQANLAAVISLANRHSTVLADRLIHHSLLVGIKASGAKLKRFAHNDLNDLESKLKLCSECVSSLPPLVLTESLFSMEGTTPLLREIAILCEKFGANLFVDEAHALGIMGIEGRGLSYELGERVSVISGTFGKAFGSGGAFLASDTRINEHLLQTSGAFRYSTALAPPLAAAALEALKLIKSNPSWGLQLLKRAKYWRSSFIKQGWTQPLGDGPILPLLIGSDQETLRYQKSLENAGLLSIAIRPPTVPEGTSRLRLVVRRDLPETALPKLLRALAYK